MHTDIQLPAPCLSSSAAEFVDVCAGDSFNSSRGSKRKRAYPVSREKKNTHTCRYTLITLLTSAWYDKSAG